MPAINKPLQKTLKLLHSFEDGALILLVITIIALSCSQIILRNLGIGGMTWSEPAIRANVLWLAMFGALHASRQQNHISINIMSHYLTEKAHKVIHFLVSISCTFICSTAAYYSLLFVKNEQESDVVAFLNIPAWILEAIIPYTLTIIAIRFLFHSLHLPENHVDDI